MGDMAEMYDDYFEGWYDDYQPRDTRIKCNHCGKHATWHHTGVRWRLINDDGNFHTCTKPASVDEFDDIS